MEKVFDLIHTHDCSDATSWYDIVNKGNFTLRDAIDYIAKMARPDTPDKPYCVYLGEFGGISCKKDQKEYFICRYDRDSVEFDKNAEQFLDKKFVSGIANGGWGNMDYTFVLSEEEPNTVSTDSNELELPLIKERIYQLTCDAKTEMHNHKTKMESINTEIAHLMKQMLKLQKQESKGDQA